MTMIRSAPTGAPIAPAWWHVLHLSALDAPLVAVLWQELVAAILAVHLLPMERGALFLAVWAIYLADRWLDTTGELPSDAPLRQRFAKRWRALFGMVAVAAGALGILVALAGIPETVAILGLVLILPGVYRLLRHQREGGRHLWLRIFFVVLMGLVGYYFLQLIGIAPYAESGTFYLELLVTSGVAATLLRQKSKPLVSKSLLTAVIFVIGIILAPGFHSVPSSGFVMIFTIGLIMLGTFWLNLLLVEEVVPFLHRAQPSSPQPAAGGEGAAIPADRPDPQRAFWALHLINAAAVFLYAFTHPDRSIWLISGAVVLSTLLLGVVFAIRSCVRGDIFVMLADVCMLTPLVFIPVARSVFGGH